MALVGFNTAKGKAAAPPPPSPAESPTAGRSSADSFLHGSAIELQPLPRSYAYISDHGIAPAFDPLGPAPLSAGEVVSLLGASLHSYQPAPVPGFAPIAGPSSQRQAPGPATALTPASAPVAGPSSQQPVPAPAPIAGPSAVPPPQHPPHSYQPVLQGRGQHQAAQVARPPYNDSVLGFVLHRTHRLRGDGGLHGLSWMQRYQMPIIVGGTVFGMLGLVAVFLGVMRRW